MLGLLLRAGGAVVKWGTVIWAGDSASRAMTGEGLVENVADAISDNIVQPILEGVAEAGVDSEQHASGQSLISWGNWVASIPGLGQSGLGQWISQLLRNWGEQYQNADSENDGSSIPSTADNEIPAAAGITTSAFNGAALGATLGMIVPGVGTVVGTAIGTAGGIAYGAIDQWTDGGLTSTFNNAMYAVGLRASPPTQAPNVVAPTP